MAPLWVALFALLVWKEKLNRTFWLGLLAALIGAVIILGSDLLQHPQFGLGDVLAWISSLFYAAYFLVTQRTRQRVSTLRYLFMVNIISAVLLFAYNFATGIPVSGYPLRTYLVFLAIGLFSHTIGYFCITYALGHLPASLVAPTMIAQLVLTSLLAILLAGETLSLLQMVGGAAVLAGIYLVNRSDSANAQSESAAAETPQAGF
jgi:drug/metabolite transporter (DMT)-like permease